MIFQQMLSRFKDKKQKFRHALEEQRIQQTVQDRLKSSNERELDRFEEEARQKIITSRLENFRQQRNKEDRRTFMFDGGNHFKGKATMLQNNDKLFKGGSIFLK